MKNLLIVILSIASLSALAQNKILTHDDFDRWMAISSTQISPDGEYIVYQLDPGKGDGEIHITSKSGKELITIPRGSGAKISWDSKFVVCNIKPQLEVVNDLRRKKTEDDKMPKDTLAIYDLTTKSLIKIARVKSFDLPKESAGELTYMLEEPLPVIEKKEDAKSDSIAKEKPKKKEKKVGKKNGYHLVVRSLENGSQDTIKYVTQYELAKRSNNFIYHTTGQDSTIKEGVYYYTFADRSHKPLCRAEGKYKQFALSEDALQVAFLSDLDTTKALIRDFQLRYWNAGRDSAEVIVKMGTSDIKSDWLVSDNGKVYFSESGQRLFFGTAPKSMVQDTSVLAEEIIDVEVWNYKDGKLYTQQNVEVEDDRNRNYLTYFDTLNEKIITLGNENIPYVKLAKHGDSDYALGYSNLPYEKYISWEGYPLRYDIYSIDVNTGKAKMAKEDLRGTPDLSAEGNFLLWYNAEDSVWYSYENSTGKTVDLTSSIDISFADEELSTPNYPDPYGLAGFTTGDQNLLLYDRFDIWKIDPRGQESPVNLTNGRASQLEYRVEDLDKTEEALSTDLLLLHTRNDVTKEEGLALMTNFETPQQVLKNNARYTDILKAKNASTLTFRTGNHAIFPDVWSTNTSLKKPKQVSNANPQQKEYAWGTVELVSWMTEDSIKLEGLLYKPANFDPSKKYPMIVNFYETHSDDLHDHWGVVPHRSTINAAFYANRGYLVFNPDIHYTTGYPGQSALKCVTSGTKHLIEKGFVNEKKIGLQGHSWGGYEIAYMITQTNMFACAEAGAVVSNMISAYGGIRWGTGLSRMFQYEHGQSRIGQSLWENPDLYIKNSPIFYADKVKTPLLMMHNDMDHAVPWYQGIEYFVALRRLGKPVWMLNYSGERHWPETWEKKRDFNVRMNQFFDYYLMDKPMPEWMAEGVPATEKDINSGLELIKN